MDWLVVLLLVPLSMQQILQGKIRNATVKGTFLCNNKRVPDIEVGLWEDDAPLNPTPMHDQPVFSNEDGEFYITGSESDGWPDDIIEPYIHIEHDCNVPRGGKRRQVRFYVPAETLEKVYDMTYISLDIFYGVDNNNQGEKLKEL